MPRARAVPFVVLMVLIAAACTGGAAGAPEGTSTRVTNPPTGAAQGGTTAVPEVLDFTAQRLGGGTIEGSRYAGAPLAIWFWAPW